MHIFIDDSDKEGVSDHWMFMKALRTSGIFVHSGGISGDTLSGGIQHMFSGDEEAIQYYFDLWQDGYRGEPRDDLLLQMYIKRGEEQYVKLKEGPTGLQG